MEPNDLFSLYSTRLQRYEKDFKIEATAPFKLIEIHSNPEIFEWDRLGLKDDDKNYHLHKQMEDIFPEFIDFAALLSFIPMKKRKNWNFIKLLFVIKFSKSKHSLLTKMVNEFTLKFIQEGFFDPNVDGKFLLTVCSNISIEIIMTDYFSILMELSSISAQFDVIFPIYYNFISKRVRAEIILQFLNKPLELYYLFQRTQNDKRELLKIYQEYHFASFFFINYGKVGLATFLGELYLNPIIISQNILVIDLFGEIPFITQCYVQNGKIMLYFVLPLDSLPVFRNYLTKLQHVNLITHFYILQLKSYESNIYLNRTQNKRSYINSFLPFSGRLWFLFNRPLQKLPNSIDKHYGQKINYTPSCSKFPIRPIHLLLLFAKSDMFHDLYCFSNMRDFLSNAKKIISSKVELWEFPLRIQNSTKLSEAYDYFIESRFFNEYTDFASARNTLESYQMFPQDSFPSNFLKPGKKIIAYAAQCKYPDLGSLENCTGSEFLNEIAQISGLRNKHQISQYRIEKNMNQLFSSQILLENRGNLITQFFDQDQRFFMVQIRTKNKQEWFEGILFVNFLSIFENAEENGYNYQILLSADYWRVFIRFLTLTPIYWIDSLPASPIPTPTHELFFFYNHSKQKWDRYKFSLVKNSNQIASLVKKYLPLHNQSIPFNPVHDEKTTALFPSFSLYKFMQGVFILRKDNEIAQKLMKSPSPYFDFLLHTFLTPSLDMDSTKFFLRENYNLEFAQIQRVLAILPKQRLEPQSDEEWGRYLLIIQDYLFPCHPRVLLHDRLLKVLFCPGLQHVFFFGGIKEGVLVLEYLFPKSLVSSIEFRLQKLLNKIEQKYLLKLRLQQITDEYRFVSPEYTPTASLEIKQYQQLSLKKTERHISHPSFVHLPQTPPNLRAMKDIPDAFWQVVGHPVTLFVHIRCSTSMKNPLMNMLMQLPIGQILVSEGDSKPFDVELIAWIHLAEAINYALYQLFEILDKEEVRYFISPIIDYSIINDPNLKLPIKIGLDMV
jgi:hypothetical protein